MQHRRWHWLDSQIKDHKWSIGVEVGVLFGQNLAYLLRENPGLQMIGIDFWRPCKGYTVEEMEEYKEAALVLTDLYPSRLGYVEDSSNKAHQLLPDACFDFVFIDADHNYYAVYRDLLNYRRKVRPGGLLCGHDYRKEGVYRALHNLYGHEAHEVGIDNCWFIRV